MGCIRRGHEFDPNLTAYELLVNMTNKASAVLSLLHLIKNSGIAAEDVDFVIECSEEAAGDMNQRGGGNFAKAIAEIAGCVNASGCDVRGFCAGPVNAVLAGASMVAAGTRKNVAVIAGGAIPKLSNAIMSKIFRRSKTVLAPSGIHSPRRRQASRHSLTPGETWWEQGPRPRRASVLTLEPLQVGLSLTVDKYAELQPRDHTACRCREMSLKQTSR